MPRRLPKPAPLKLTEPMLISTSPPPRCPDFGPVGPSPCLIGCFSVQQMLILGLDPELLCRFSVGPFILRRRRCLSNNPCRHRCSDSAITAAPSPAASAVKFRAQSSRSSNRRHPCSELAMSRLYRRLNPSSPPSILNPPPAVSVAVTLSAPIAFLGRRHCRRRFPCRLHSLKPRSPLAAKEKEVKN
ncbi:hypothetical protein M0R45_026280 [Rubus argutus]|uniref:Uncharacterized protein n=1 Tax=Rubus argutus TaxID=59490 RepID=A0AAW1WZE0_RUBAR